jgi:hypothetical protein
VGDTVRYAIEPTGQRIGIANGAWLAEQEQKRGLKDIVDVWRLPEQALTDPANHGTVPLHEGGEGGLIMFCDEPGE